MQLVSHVSNFGSLRSSTLIVLSIYPISPLLLRYSFTNWDHSRKLGSLSFSIVIYYIRCHKAYQFWLVCIYFWEIGSKDFEHFQKNSSKVKENKGLKTNKGKNKARKKKPRFLRGFGYENRWGESKIPIMKAKDIELEQTILWYNVREQRKLCEKTLLLILIIPNEYIQLRIQIEKRKYNWQLNLTFPK